MATITFSDRETAKPRNRETAKPRNRETENRALAFLIGRFWGRVLRSGEHVVPEAALEALASQNIPFTTNLSQLSHEHSSTSE